MKNRTLNTGSLPPGNYNIIQNSKTGKWYAVPTHPPAPPFKPRDRKRGNKYT